MEYQLNIKLDSAAFGDDPELELYRVLQQAAKRILDRGVERGQREWRLLDSNGNAVGFDKIAEVRQ